MYYIKTYFSKSKSSARSELYGNLAETGPTYHSQLPPTLKSIRSGHRSTQSFPSPFSLQTQCAPWQNSAQYSCLSKTSIQSVLHKIFQYSSRNQYQSDWSTQFLLTPPLLCDKDAARNTQHLTSGISDVSISNSDERIE